MTETTGFRTEIDGRPASADELSALAFAGFAHFTAMQVRDGAVRGLDLHLARLRSASMEFFGRALPDDSVRQRLRSAIADGPSALSLTATMYSRNGEFTPHGAADDPAVLVRTAPAFGGPKGPLRLNTVQHERPLPSIKHVGEASKTYYLRQAVNAGYDDAAFLDARGFISEATIWNLAFWDGDAVVWPKANMLAGITMAILRRQLDALGIAQREERIDPAHMGEFKGAAVMNSWTPGVPVKTLGSTALPVSQAFIDVLGRAYEREPLTVI
ncbi:aminotransferase class IV family protein [Pelagibacterium xiamenense]|uniref:aminotransferase class IV family protein n=1 Tax=Pelagibacterium xiamenense TaxID=2901140 RepID=UPI001E53CFFC|nr:aminotransferase class IV family protein [Pelagibacterium xiamenense]MCD7058492.1 aminotransferase class IV family protein [Pelagibacterium xiamenense]